MFLFIGMIVASGKFTYFLLNKFVYGEQDGTSQEQKFTPADLPIKRANQTKGEHVPFLTPKDLGNKSFFGRQRNYFI